MVNISGTDDTFVQDCSCDIDCISSQTCCADFALSKPISLVSVFGEPRLLIDRCYRRSSGNISKLCEGDGDENNVISLIPIPNYEQKFKNIYCFACNDIMFTYNDITEFTYKIGMENVKIDCNFSPNFHPALSPIISVLNLFNRYSGRTEGKACTIRTRDNGFRFEGLHHNSTRSCNISGKWQTYDADIDWACQNYLQIITPFSLPSDPYYNIFCQICNMDERLIHASNKTTEEASCNTSSVFDTLNPLMEKLCYNQSSIITRFPIKTNFVDVVFLS